MRTPPIKFFVLGLALAAGFLSAQETSLKTTEAVLAAIIEANGGQEGLDEIQTLWAVGEIENADGVVVEVTVVRKRPTYKRVTTVLPNQVRVTTGFDGKMTWKETYFPSGASELVELEGEAKERFEEDRYFLDVLLTPQSEDLSHELTGTEYIGRVPCYVIETELDGKRRRSWVDSRTFRVLQTVEQRTDVEGAPEVFYRMENYTRVNGSWIARQVERLVDGKAELTIRFDRVRANTGIYDSYFIKPSSD